MRNSALLWKIPPGLAFFLPPACFPHDPAVSSRLSFADGRSRKPGKDLPDTLNAPLCSMNAPSIICFMKQMEIPAALTAVFEAFSRRFWRRAPHPRADKIRRFLLKRSVPMSHKRLMALAAVAALLAGCGTTAPKANAITLLV